MNEEYRKAKERYKSARSPQEQRKLFTVAERYRQHLLSYRSYLTEQRAFEAFRTAGRNLVWPVMGVVLGIALYVFGWIQSKQPDPAALISTPTVATLALTSSALAALATCAGTEKVLQVVVLQAKSTPDEQVLAKVVPLRAGYKLSPVNVKTPDVSITLPPSRWWPSRRELRPTRRRLYYGMKTAISLSDQLYQRAERFARGRQLSRSELYARALEAYLAEHEGPGVTERLDALYAEEDSALSPEVRELGFEALRRGRE